MGAFLSWTLIVLFTVCWTIGPWFTWGEPELVAVVVLPVVALWLVTLPKDEAWERWGWGS